MRTRQETEPAQNRVVVVWSFSAWKDDKDSDNLNCSIWVQALALSHLSLLFLLLFLLFSFSLKRKFLFGSSSLQYHTRIEAGSSRRLCCETYQYGIGTRRALLFCFLPSFLLLRSKEMDTGPSKVAYIRLSGEDAEAAGLLEEEGGNSYHRSWHTSQLDEFL